MTAPLRFTLTHLSGGRLSVRCAGAEATSERGLARLLVEADFPDRPIAAGRVGKTDWTFPSLHRFAAGSVSAAEADQAPERLHPALRASVVALRAAKATAAVVVACLALAVFQPAHAAPPAPGTEDYEIMRDHGEWVRSLRANGMSCCDWSDTRPVKVRTVGDRWQIWLRPDQIIGAPVEQWLDVPDDAIIRGPNPVGMAIASWWGGRVRCFVPPVQL